MLFLRGTTPILGTQDLPGRFKEWKACLVEIVQTAHWHINIWGMVEETCPHGFFVAHCGFQVQY